MSLSVVENGVYRSYETRTDLDEALEDTEVAKSIEKQVRSLSHLDKSLKGFANVGDLLRIALSYTSRESTFSGTLSVLTDYEEILGDSIGMTDQIVRRSCISLSHHTEAYRLVIDEKNPNGAKEWMVKCASIAHEMADKFQALKEKTEKLHSSAKTNLQEVTKARYKTIEDKEKIETSFKEIKIKKAKLDYLQKTLQDDLDDLERERTKVSKKLKKAERNILGLVITSAVVEPFQTVATTGLQIGSALLAPVTVSGLISENVEKLDTRKNDLLKSIQELRTQLQVLRNVGTSQNSEEVNAQITRLEEEIRFKEEQLKKQQKAIETLQQLFSDKQEELLKKEKNLHEKVQELKKELRDNNSELIESIECLQNAVSTNSDLDKAISSIGITLSVIQRVTRIFNETRIYWQEVEDQCRSLGNLDFDLAEKSGLKSFLSMVRRSEIGWLTVAKINIEGNEMLKQTKVKVEEQTQISTLLEQDPVKINILTNLIKNEIEEEKKALEEDLGH